MPYNVTTINTTLHRLLVQCAQLIAQQNVNVYALLALAHMPGRAVASGAL